MSEQKWAAISLALDGTPLISVGSRGIDFTDEQILDAAHFIRRYGRIVALLDAFCGQSSYSHEESFVIPPDEVLEMARGDDDLGDFIRSRLPFVEGYALRAMNPPPRERPKKIGVPGYIYAVWAGNLFKIGRSGSPEIRIESLMNSIPIDAEMFGIKKVDDCVKEEKRLHKKFSSTRRRGEWFELTDTQIGDLASYFEDGMSIEELEALPNEEDDDDTRARV